MSYKDYLESEQWAELRAAALDRDGHQCRLCASPLRLQVHHRTYARIFDERVEDLTTLCNNCHALFSMAAKVKAPKRGRRKKWASRVYPVAAQIEPDPPGKVEYPPGEWGRAMRDMEKYSPCSVASLYRSALVEEKHDDDASVFTVAMERNSFEWGQLCDATLAQLCQYLSKEWSKRVEIKKTATASDGTQRRENG